MNVPKFSRRVTKGIYRVVRVCVRCIYVLALLLIIAFIFLRIHGVPDPLLREIIRRVNTAGIPVEMDALSLTLPGWRADQVRYYSKHPDDLAPVFQASRVFFSLRNSMFGNTVSSTWKLDVEAVGIAVNPSIEWGVEIPEGNTFRHVDEVEVSLEFLPDRIVFSGGKMSWLGSQFNLKGTLLKGEKKSREPTVEPAPPVQKPILPVYFTEQQFQTWETRLKTISLPNGALVDLDFMIDPSDYAASRLDLAIATEELDFRGVGFSKAKVRGSYAYPRIQIERIALFQDRQSVQWAGEYNLESGEAKGSLYNTITSNRLLLLFPENVLNLLVKAELRIDYLPRLEIDFVPSAINELLNHASGTFSVRGLAYKGIEIETLRGTVNRENNRIEFTNLHGSVLGQEDRADEMGSAMHGGSAEGTVFWDGNTHEFGVDVDASLDPNILVRALAPIEIATNIIRRFSFKDQPPRGHVSVGADLDDLDSFYIDIRALGNEATIQGVDFSSINVTQTYKHGKLNLDPVAAMQGVRFIKGSTWIDFRRETASFDVLSSMHPVDLEDLIYPGFNLFGKHLKTTGDMLLSAHGIFDWGSMLKTDFSVQAEAERFELPFAVTDCFKAEVVGDGPVISVKNATFGLYEGSGTGEFSMAWKPSEKHLPYEIDLSFSDVNFRKCLEFLSTNRVVKVSGKMEGRVHLAADMSTNFFSAVNGEGYLKVDDGQLADLPLFNGFSRLMRKVFPTFTIFSITSLQGHYTLSGGVITSEDAYFEGDVLSAKASGSYTQSTGFDAKIHAQLFSESRLSKVVRVITDPLMKLFELKLEGSLSDPSWKLEKFP